jgi:hypothetical protein
MDATFILILTFGIFIGFYVQTVVGFAGSLMALPILLLGMDLPNAIAYISIFYLFSSVFLITKEWQHIDKKIILKLAITSVIGVILGIVVLTFSKPILLKKALGIFILIYAAYVAFGKTKIVLNKGGIIGFGVLAGFFSGVFSTGGPLYVMCIENTVKEVQAFRATMIGVLGLVTITRVPALAVSGILDFNHLKISLLVFPAFLLAQFLGKLTFRKINETMFKRVLMILLSVSGLILLL